MSFFYALAWLLCASENQGRFAFEAGFSSSHTKRHLIGSYSPFSLLLIRYLLTFSSFATKRPASMSRVDVENVRADERLKLL